VQFDKKLGSLKSILLICALATIGVSGCSENTGDSKTYKLVTGPQGGAWYPLGGALKALIENGQSEIKVQVLPGGGVSNVLALHTGQAQIALAQSVTSLDAIEGKAPFKEPLQNICNIATFYRQYFQVVTLAESGVNSPYDLKGKVLATQPRGATGEAITNHLLLAHDMDYKTLENVSFGSYTDSVTLMKDGNADVFTLTTTIPSGAVMDLASSRTMKLMPMSIESHKKMLKINSKYERGVIPKGTYPEQNEDVPTIFWYTHLAARCDVSNDVVAHILDVVQSGSNELVSVTKAIEGLDMATMTRDIGVPMHPGATQWYAEQSKSKIKIY
jgi:TRAP transporter TAXI family solute receptor